MGFQSRGHGYTASAGDAQRPTLQFVDDVPTHGLRAFHERHDQARLPALLVQRLRRILFRLWVAMRSGSADAPGSRLHPLKGDRAGASGACGCRATGAWYSASRKARPWMWTWQTTAEGREDSP